MSATPFEITWKKDGALLLRENATGDFDTAFIGAWLDCPRVAAMSGADPDAIEFFDPATGRTISESVPPATPPSMILPLAQKLSLTVLGVIGLAALYGAGWPGDSGWMKKPLAELAMAGAGSAFIFLMANGRWPIKPKRATRPAKPIPDTPHHRVVIAHLSLPWLLLWMIPCLVVGAWLILAALSDRIESGGWSLHAPLLLAGGALCLAYAWTRLRLVLFGGRAALWIEAGELVLRARGTACAPICGITDIYVGRTADRARRRCIWASGEDGEAAFSTCELAEPPDMVVTRLRTMLRLGPHLELKEDFPFSRVVGRGGV